MRALLSRVCLRMRGFYFIIYPEILSRWCKGMALRPYKTLIRRADDSFIINKSHFIGYGCPCETEEEALAFLQ